MHEPTPSNRDLLIPYFAPYLAYVGIASLLSNVMPIEINYVIRLLVVPALLFWAWRWYVPMTGPKNPFVSVLYGMVFGLAGLVVWVVLYTPFAPANAQPWSNAGFYLRLMSASLVVPVFEEIAMRGYIFRFALQWDMIRKDKTLRKSDQGSFFATLDNTTIAEVKPGAWNVPAVLISTVVFTLGHTVPEWPASVAYGILMSLVWIIRKDLLTCIIAHGTTNLALALYVYYSGRWELW